jgi:REP element-mobilizing transposase RayT
MHAGMPNQLFLHLTWTTLDRHPMIGSHEARVLDRYLPAEALRHRCNTIAVGIVADHVHIVLRLPSRFDLPRLVQGLKGASSHLVNLDSVAGLRWAKGYEARTVSPASLRHLVRYVRSQGKHHPSRAIRQ